MLIDAYRNIIFSVGIKVGVRKICVETLRISRKTVLIKIQYSVDFCIQSM